MPNRPYVPQAERFRASYDAAALHRLARKEVRGKGKYIGWHLIVHTGGCTLAVHYEAADVRGKTLDWNIVL